MAGHEWEDWFEREEFIGQISDIRVQNLQVEREVVQKRTFTRWMNLHLEKCKPPIEVHDLFRDIQDGRILMALLEELSGCKLLHGFKQSSHRIFRLNNIAKVLTFLEERNVKLVSIDAADVADGNSSIVLGLIWNIILFFQIKELTGNIKSQFPSSSSLSSIPNSSDSDTSHSSTPSDERRPSIAMRDHGKAIKTLLQWVQRRTRKYGVAVHDFGKSWTSGLAFLAVIKSIDPSLVDMRRALLRSSRENIEEAFRTAHYSLGIARLLEPEDVTINPPDEQSIMTYVSQFLEHFPGIEEDDVSEFIERSKVSTRMNESMIRNGVQNRREKSYVVRRDWVQPPPKIFISSVSDDSEQASSPVLSQTSENRPWASEGLSMESRPSPADDRPLSHSLDLDKDVSCTVSTSSSPQPSFVDSVIDSPDSWGEMPSEAVPLEKLRESRSDGSLNESSLACHLKDSTSTDDVKPDQQSPLVPGMDSPDQMDTELFIDEGNFSLSSVESLQAKSQLASEEEDVYKYILDLNEEGTANQVPNHETMNKSDTGSEQKGRSSAQNNETVKPSSHELSDGGSDSGYFPEHKETVPAQHDTDNKNQPSVLSDEPEVDVEDKMENKSACRQNTDAKQTYAPELSSEPAQITIADNVEDEPECPVKDEKISLESEGDVKPLCSELSEEALQTQISEAQDIHDVPNGQMESQEGSGIHRDELLEKTRNAESAKKDQTVQRELEESAEKEDQTVHSVCGSHVLALDPEESLAQQKNSGEQVCIDPDVPQSSTICDASEDSQENIQSQRDKEDAAGFVDSSGTPAINDFRDRNQKTPDGLCEMNVDAADVTTPSEVNNHELDFNLGSSKVCQMGDGIPCGEDPSQVNVITFEKLNGTEGRLEDELNETESKLEGQLSEAENKLEDEVSCNVNSDSSDTGSSQVTDTAEVGEAKDNRAVSVISLDMVHYDIPISKVIEAFVDPDPEALGIEEDKQLDSASPWLHSPPVQAGLESSAEQSAEDQPSDGQDEGQATAEKISAASEQLETEPTELRLSLSVTALQPAPAQHTLPDSETESEDGLAENSEDLTQHKAGEGPPELQAPQCPPEPWKRHSGDWGAVEIDMPAEHCELIKTDEEQATARENMETLREVAISDNAVDESLFSTTLRLRKTDSNELKSESEKTIDSINFDKRRECRTPENQGKTCGMALSEVYFILIVWVILYCLFVLPQMDIWMLPHLLLNLEE